MKTTLAAFFFVLCASSSFASTISGQVVLVRLNQTAGGATRVSLQVSSTSTSCGNPYFSYEYPDSGAGAGIGKAWTAALLAAQASGRPVTIVGTGNCDQYSIEIVNYIDTL